MKLTRCQISVSLRRLFTPFILKSGPAPLAITAKISPSVDPRTHVASARFAGFTPLGTSGPLPSPVSP